MMDLISPTYIINEKIARNNIRRMAAKAAENQALFRPHFKTHQSRLIGRWFKEEGVTAITVSSLSMADYFASDGWNDITVAFPVNLHEINLINRLSGCIRLGLTIEDLNTVKQLDQLLTSHVDLYIKIDSGYHRTGLEPADRDEIVAIVVAARGSRNLNFKGLIAHSGHTYQARTIGEVYTIAALSLECMKMIKSWIPDSDRCLISIGDTPSCSLLDDFGGVDEIRPGNFVFYDLMQMQIGSCQFEQVAGVVACPVVAVHSHRNQAVIFGGAVHLSKDRLEVAGQTVFGQLVEWTGLGWGKPIPESYLVSLSQEHGILEAPSAVIRKLIPGSWIGILPVHSCLTANLLRGYRTLDGVDLDHLSGF